jgi:hypothetical protein
VTFLDFAELWTRAGHLTWVFSEGTKGACLQRARQVGVIGQIWPVGLTVSRCWQSTQHQKLCAKADAGPAVQSHHFYQLPETSNSGGLTNELQDTCPGKFDRCMQRRSDMVDGHMKTVMFRVVERARYVSIIIWVSGSLSPLMLCLIEPTQYPPRTRKTK